MIQVIGAGLAGCEAAWQIAAAGEEAELWEMKPARFSPAHKNPNFAELVCSNSLKAARVESAAGLLKEEMRRLGSLLTQCAQACAVPAGGALAVDREEFSALVTRRIQENPRIHVRTGVEVEELPPEGIAVVATGPLTSDALAEKIMALCGGGLSFFDAAAPIVTAESIDLSRVFRASRYDKGGDDAYLNCPMDRAQYEAFREELVQAERAPVHDFDVRDPKVYEGCMPIEVLAQRGVDAMRYGPMKPVGLRDPATGRRPWAVVQLRREDREGRLYNLVGFQTNLKFGEQKRVFGQIPGLEHAEFTRYGVMHRNTFLDSPRLLQADFSLRQDPRLFFAGQITGVEGYMESAASGIMAGKNAVRRLRGQPPLVLPRETMIGALSRYAAEGGEGGFQPMGANFGIVPPLGMRIKDKRDRYAAFAARGLETLAEFMSRQEIG
ncbi:MAG TPA: methylenetetrahydrofolate--tRNA-(uracil(54)-C(5))-methyltransferase (FADH(2)-oxidizing) TrmFO [Candidatus Caccousia avistercoris]|nr:methylenetetrahydrofolate--tRNA-(uracil(54)-C(5))-methyltransferase (FADH(2)-oxidizing) TrmFO [Candidatus Caccousia avistercoris]